MHDWLDDILSCAFDDAGRSANWLTDWMTAGQRESVAREGDRAVCRYGPRVLTAGTICCFLFAGLTIVGLLMTGDGRWMAVPAGLFLAGSAWFRAAAAVERIDFDPSTLRWHRLWHADVTVDWTDVESVDYSEWASSYVVNAGPAGRVRVGNLIDGCSAVVRMARANARDNKNRRRPNRRGVG